MFYCYKVNLPQNIETEKFFYTFFENSLLETNQL
jgi:hypothetical protein